MVQTQLFSSVFLIYISYIVDLGFQKYNNALLVNVGFNENLHAILGRPPEAPLAMGTKMSFLVPIFVQKYLNTFMCFAFNGVLSVQRAAN